MTKSTAVKKNINRRKVITKKKIAKKSITSKSSKKKSKKVKKNLISKKPLLTNADKIEIIAMIAALVLIAVSMLSIA